MEIFFITSNKGKASTLQRSFVLAGRSDIKVIQKDLNIIEPQAENVSEVSKWKAREAFKLLNAPVVVEDGGLCIDAFNGFLGVYTKDIHEKIGNKGILKLLAGEKNRVVTFDSFTSFIDENGELYQFERDRIEYDISENEKEITNADLSWSSLWKILYVREFGKNLCEFSEEELDEYYKLIDHKGSLQKFSKWLMKKY